jgi:hypothetical protein
MTRRPAVFLGLSEIAGYFGNLEAGLRELGVRTTYLNVLPDPFHYDRGRTYGYLGRLASAPSSWPPRGVGRGARARLVARHVVRYLARAMILAMAAVRHDTFVLGGTEHFLPRGAELRLLKLARRRVIWVFLGSDHRPPYLNGRLLRTLSDDELLALTRRLEARVRTVERWADVVVAHSASAQFHRRPYVRLLAVGIPTAEDAAVSAPSGSLSTQTVDGPRPLRLVHAPSDPESKGTDEIRLLVERLRTSGVGIDYVEIIGKPHAHVLEVLASSDLLIDEVYGDTPMGTVSMEAALFGTPTLVSGYFADWLRLHEDPLTLPPTAYVQPAQLGATLELLARDADRRRALGAQAQAFVLRRWGAAHVALRYLDMAAGRSPDDWLVRSDARPYVLGWGISASALQAALLRLTTTYGMRSLRLEDGSPAQQAIADLLQTDRQLR